MRHYHGDRLDQTATAVLRTVSDLARQFGVPVDPVAPRPGMSSASVAGRAAAAAAGRKIPLRVVIVLGALSAFGPLSMDLYLPALPQLARDLHSPPPLRS